ncbi:twin-arginine translocase subunit TatC [Zooshikella harenae]|uniref:Sec-independent protein translocase protein TatC n=1 Tax=Zooshikella harenae TaxID=2827238 RepID=A0ABS5Z6C6_9GAMM|nr:twin-arginine translocase subunit TatC [Zooshikella harenae]MBU2709597.1 twin-arginine translocase subunit TatC [Zooshikella harenae]
MSSQNSSTEETHNNDKEQPFIEHLTELRSRLLRVFITIGVAFVLLIPFANIIYEFISLPLRELLPEGSTMIATEVASPLLAPFKLTIIASIFLTIPYILHQAWSFIAPGLYHHERRLAIPLLASSVLLFYLGVAFAYFVVFPLLFDFFTKIGPTDVAIMTDINKYLDFVLKLFLAFGSAFEIPIATVLLIWSGVASVESLKAKRPYIIVICFVVGMLLTPPDIISQSLLAIPMWLLFESGLFFGKMITQRSSETTNH